MKKPFRNRNAAEWLFATILALCLWLGQRKRQKIGRYTPKVERTKTPAIPLLRITELKS